MAGAAYSLADVPASEVGSRFFLSRTESGQVSDPARQLARVAATLAGRLRAGQTRLEVKPISVAIKRVVRTAGGCELADRAVLTGVPAYESSRPGKRFTYRGEGSALDSFLLGGVCFEKLPDDEVWKALRDVAEAHGLSGEALTDLNDAVAIAVAARAGLHVLPRFSAGRTGFPSVELLP